MAGNFSGHVSKPSPKPKKSNLYGDTAIQPPPFTYDPALEAQRRAAERGLEDVRDDTARDLRRNRQDWRTQRRDINVTKNRGIRDINLGLRRGKQDLGFRRADILTDRARGIQDFGTRLNNLVENFRVRQAVDRQGINVAGAAEGGAMAASDRVRGEQFSREAQTIATGEQRLREDAASALRRLNISGQRLRQDTRTDRTRLRKDTRHDLRLGGRTYKRGQRDLKTALQRAIREQQFADADILTQEIFDARQRDPGAFTKYGGKKKGGKK